MIMYIILGSIVIGSIFFGLYINNLYKKYDQKESLKEEIDGLKKSVDEAMRYFEQTYCNDFDHTVYETLRIKVNFITKIIRNKSLEEQKTYYKKLYERLYETGYRLKTDFYNVEKIILPLSSLIKEICESYIS